MDRRSGDLFYDVSMVGPVTGLEEMLLAGHGASELGSLLINIRPMSCDSDRNSRRGHCILEEL